MADYQQIFNDRMDKNQNDDIYTISISVWSCNAALFMSRETRGQADY